MVAFLASVDSHEEWAGYGWIRETGVGFWRCSSVPRASYHFFEKLFAHRVSQNLAIFGIILDRCPELLFLTKFKNIYSSSRKNIFREDENFQNFFQKNSKIRKSKKSFSNIFSKNIFSFSGKYFPKIFRKYFPENFEISKFSTLSENFALEVAMSGGFLDAAPAFASPPMPPRLACTARRAACVVDLPPGGRSWPLPPEAGFPTPPLLPGGWTAALTASLPQVAVSLHFYSDNILSQTGRAAHSKQTGAMHAVILSVAEERSQAREECTTESSPLDGGGGATLRSRRTQQ